MVGRQLGLTCADAVTTMRMTNRMNMKKQHVVTAVLWVAVLALIAPISSAQRQGGSKAQAIAQQLNLTPEQKGKIVPILADEVPKVEKIKADNSISKIQKAQQIKAIHQQTDPQMKAILTPEQYKKLQDIRRQALSDAIHNASH
jgi:Spy/CpxP family protein refolding chaperone